MVLNDASGAGGRFERLAGLNVFGAPTFFVERTGSTMDDARSLALGGAPPGTVVTTRYQESGRGRRGGRWHAAPGESLLFTIFFAAAASRAGGPLALVAGLALSRCLKRALSLEPQIKWPNDVLVGGRKIAGILCETKRELTYMGIGLNCNQAVFPGAVEWPATSVLRECGRRVEPLELLPTLLDELRDALSDERWREEIDRRLYRRDAAVTITAAVGPAGAVAPDDAEGGLGAVIRGVGPHGELLVSIGGRADPIALTSGRLRYAG